MMIEFTNTSGDVSVFFNGIARSGEFRIGQPLRKITKTMSSFEKCESVEFFKNLWNGSHELLAIVLPLDDNIDFIESQGFIPLYKMSPWGSFQNINMDNEEKYTKYYKYYTSNEVKNIAKYFDLRPVGSHLQKSLF